MSPTREIKPPRWNRRRSARLLKTFGASGVNAARGNTIPEDHVQFVRRAPTLRGGGMTYHEAAIKVAVLDGDDPLIAKEILDEMKSMGLAPKHADEQIPAGQEDNYIQMELHRKRESKLQPVDPGRRQQLFEMLHNLRRKN